MICADVLTTLETIAPTRWAWSWDRVGLQVGSPSAEIEFGVTCLDLTPELAEGLSPKTCVVAHHPLIWDPMPTVRTDTPQGRALGLLLAKECCLIAAHTNWDVAPGGINDTLSSRLGLESVQPFGVAAPQRYWKAVVFVPENSVDAVLNAASALGAGVIGNYSRCAFWNPGEGTFRPEAGANPAIGELGRVARTPECRLEFRVPDILRAQVEAAIRAAHPYEEPATDWVALAEESGPRIGRIGVLPSSMTLAAFRDWAEAQLGSRIATFGKADQLVTRVGVIGGAAGDEWRSARDAGADVFVSGEFKHATLAEVSGIGILEAGHFATEFPGMEAMATRLESILPELKWRAISPEIGGAGRGW